MNEENEYIVIKDNKESIFDKASANPVADHEAEANERKSRFGLMFLEKKGGLTKLITYALVIISVASWSFTIFFLLYYVVFGIKEDDQIISEMIDLSAVNPVLMSMRDADDLVMGRLKIFNISDDRYDLILKISNPNSQYYANFKYYLVVNGKRIAEQDGFILPSEEKYLSFLSRSFPSGISGARIQIEAPSWQRIDAHQIGNWASYKKSHLNFGIDDIKFTSANENAANNKQALNQLSFAVTNNTAYNYWLVDFSIGLFSGGDLAGFNRYGQSEFLSGETKVIQLSWSGLGLDADNIIIVPEVNLMDRKNYMNFTGDDTEGIYRE